MGEIHQLIRSSAFQYLLWVKVSNPLQTPNPKEGSLLQEPIADHVKKVLVAKRYLYKQKPLRPSPNTLLSCSRTTELNELLPRNRFTGGNGQLLRNGDESYLQRRKQR